MGLGLEEITEIVSEEGKEVDPETRQLVIKIIDENNKRLELHIRARMGQHIREAHSTSQA